MTKDEFLKSPKPLVFVVSIDPHTGKSNYEVTDYGDEGWMMPMIKEDSPERFAFFERNPAAVKEFAKEMLGIEKE